VAFIDEEGVVSESLATETVGSALTRDSVTNTSDPARHATAITESKSNDFVFVCIFHFSPPVSESFKIVFLLRDFSDLHPNQTHIPIAPQNPKHTFIT
jgi:hypothetical protein